MSKTRPLPTPPDIAPDLGSGTRPRARPRPAVLAGSSAALLWLAYPPVDQGFLGWFALAPLFALVRSEAPAWRVYGAFWFGGLIFGGLSMSWVAKADVSGMAWMALFMSLWWPLFLLPTRRAVRKLRVPLIVAAPTAWVGMEYLRAHVLSGFPWYYLAHTQWSYLALIQVSDLFGAWGLSLLMAMANVLWLDLLTMPLYRLTPTGARALTAQVLKAWIVGGLVAVTVMYGFVRLTTAPLRRGPRVALLQSDFPQELKNGIGMGEMLARLERLVVQAGHDEPRPDLIVWPETAYGLGFVTIDPGLSESALTRQVKRYLPESSPEDWRDRQARSTRELKALTDEFGIPMVIGAPSYEFAKTGLLRRNSAALFRPGGAVSEQYHKQALVPMGEYIPFLDAMPWLLALTPYTDGYVPSLTHGTGPLVFESAGVRYAPIICFEDTTPHLVRASALAKSENGRPDILLNLTNDGWFRGSAEHQAHLAISVFRCVECRLPMARAVNTGISAIIGGDGRVIAQLPAQAEAVLSGFVPLDGRPSLYRLIGDALGLTCLIATIASLILSFVYPRRVASLAQAPIVG